MASMHFGRACVVALVCVGITFAFVRGTARGEGPRPVQLPDGLHPERLGHLDASTDSSKCATCHADIAAEWSGSQHHAAYENVLFAAAYAAEPQRFCRGCHAPLAGGNEPDARQAHEGVSCAVCHVREGKVVSSGHALAPSAHAQVADVTWSTSRVCAGCHQFAFPGKANDGTHVALMQSTFDEWTSSAAGTRGTQCQTCHMPVRVGANGRAHRSHAFDGTSVEMLKRAVDVEVTARRYDAAQVEVTFTLRPRSIGHAFPTGDLFRNLELTVASGIETASTILTRTYRVVHGLDEEGNQVVLRRPDRDLRVPANGARVVTIRVAAKRLATLRWSLSHLRTSVAVAEEQGIPAFRTLIVDGSITLGANGS